MPDSYMNLTDAEAQALGYPVRRDPARAAVRPRPAEDIQRTGAVLVPVIVGVILLGMLAGLVNGSHESGSPRPAVSAATEPEQEAGKRVAEGTALRPASQPQRSEQYLPARWAYAVMGGPTELQRSDGINVTIPRGTEVLRTCYTLADQSFVVTLDGQAWGWAYLTPAEPARIPKQPKFEPASARMRSMEMVQSYVLDAAYRHERANSQGHALGERPFDVSDPAGFLRCGMEINPAATRQIQAAVNQQLN